LAARRKNHPSAIQRQNALDLHKLVYTRPLPEDTVTRTDAEWDQLAEKCWALAREQTLERLTDADLVLHLRHHQLGQTYERIAAMLGLDATRDTPDAPDSNPAADAWLRDFRRALDIGWTALATRDIIRLRHGCYLLDRCATRFE